MLHFRFGHPGFGFIKQNTLYGNNLISKYPFMQLLLIFVILIKTKTDDY